MTVTPKGLIQGVALSDSPNTEYTVSAGVRIWIDKFTLTNTDSSPVAVTINLVPTGGSAAAGNTVIDGKVLAAGETYTCPEIVGHVLEGGDFIVAVAGTDAVIACRASGREIT